jgi:hypothetical protein
MMIVHIKSVLRFLAECFVDVLYMGNRPNGRGTQTLTDWPSNEKERGKREVDRLF